MKLSRKVCRIPIMNILASVDHGVFDRIATPDDKQPATARPSECGVQWELLEPEATVVRARIGFVGRDEA
jgi:hypothetical protein